MASSVLRAISASVPCQTSVLELILVTQMSIAALLWESNRAARRSAGIWCRSPAGPFDYLLESSEHDRQSMLRCRSDRTGDAHMKMHTYVNFGGKCAEAFRFYEKHLGGRIGMMMTHGQAPDQSTVKPELKDAVLHARIAIGGTELMGADIPTAQPMRSAYLSLTVDSDAEAERLFSALGEGGEVFMPMQETFFATRFAQLRDRFGINWMIMHDRPMPRLAS